MPSKKRVLKWDPYQDPEDDCVEFRLTYEGHLFSAVEEPNKKAHARKQHKHDIRRALHPQLKRLWGLHPALRYWASHSPGGKPVRDPSDEHFDSLYHAAPGDSCVNAIARTFTRANGFNFVPIVREELGLLCSLSILYLRPSKPGKIISHGDIDNRLKTLFDALSVPSDAQMPSSSPAPDEQPMFVLLADDSLITHVSVETDFLLQALDPAKPDYLDPDHARIVITAKIRPYHTNNSHPLEDNSGLA